MTAVPFAIDPARRPLLVRPRPENRDFAPLPSGVSTDAAVVVLAREVRAGDLIVASFSDWATVDTETQMVTWVRIPYTADPSPWDEKCGCAKCDTTRRHFGPPPDGGRVVMTREEWGGFCDVWDADEPVLIIPAALLPAAA